MPLKVNQRYFEAAFLDNQNVLRVAALQPGITPLENDPKWFNKTRRFADICLNGVISQWV